MASIVDSLEKPGPSPAADLNIISPENRRSLCIFTRYPEPGRVKTRLIPELGARGAAELQRRMTRSTLEMAMRWKTRPGDDVRVYFEGGSEASMRALFGDSCAYFPQQAGDLGERLLRALEQTTADVPHPVLLVGADCPELEVETLDSAFSALNEHAVVVGPAADGGYYLLGLRTAFPELFQNIAWGTSAVLRQTTAAIEKLGLTCTFLHQLDDIDEPADFAAWETRVALRRALEGPPAISIIIPALNEQDHLAGALESAASASSAELIVVDGGSRDDTAGIARAFGARVVESPPGRAAQMNAGADCARGEVLLFLHADTLLPRGFESEISRCLAIRGAIAGAFRLGFDNPGLSLWIVAVMANLRSRVGQMPYGDQAIFLRRDTFYQEGRYPEIPVMEDYGLILRLRKKGRIVISRSAVASSARRWLAHGILRTTLTHQRMIAGWHLGIPPESLARYRKKSG